MSSHATLNCEAIVEACHRAADTVKLALDIAEHGSADNLAEARRNHEIVDGLIFIATATLREGHKTMQVSASDSLVLQDFYEPSVILIQAAFASTA
jgi:hypothetical protein